jgi:hypothetical protein
VRPEKRDALLGRLWSGRCSAQAPFLLAAPFEPNLLEEGKLLHSAQRIAHGEHLYRDMLAFTGRLPFEALASRPVGRYMRRSDHGRRFPRGPVYW